MVLQCATSAQVLEVGAYFLQLSLLNVCVTASSTGLHLYVDHLMRVLPVNSVAEWLAYWIRYHSTVKPVFVRSLPATS